MVNVEIELNALELQWRNADDAANAARADLAANNTMTADVAEKLRQRLERAERAKKSIMKKITLLEAKL